MRCNSSGELYPLTSRPSNESTSPSTLVALSNNLWHNRLGHPGASILNSLHRNNFIVFNKSQNNFICQSCQLGKQVKFPTTNNKNEEATSYPRVHTPSQASSTCTFTCEATKKPLKGKITFNIRNCELEHNILGFHIIH